ncbi:hypothetical protein ACSQ67_006407 [Phaseolus vulgaris]
MAESVGVGGLGVTGSTLPSFSLTRHHTSTPNISLFFRSQSHFPAFRYFTRYNPHLYAAVTSDSKATSLDLTQPDLDHTGGGSDGKGNVGGVMGFLKSGSQKSLLAGGLSASLLYYVFTELPGRPVFASSVGLGISAALLGVMGSRFKKSGKVFPAGVVSLVSLIMTGGYLHGIMRTAH